MLCWAASAHSSIFNLEYNDLEFMVSLTGRAKEEVQLRITRPGSPIFYTILVTDVPKLSALFCLLRKIDRGETTDDFKEFNRQITSTIRL
jgi:hypothetical protein